MSELKEMTKLKKKVEELKSEADKAQGAFDSCMARLKEEFDCDTIEEGRAALEDITKREAKALKKYKEAKDKFTEEWDEKL